MTNYCIVCGDTFRTNNIKDRYCPTCEKEKREVMADKQPPNPPAEKESAE